MPATSSNLSLNSPIPARGRTRTHRATLVHCAASFIAELVLIRGVGLAFPNATGNPNPHTQRVERELPSKLLTTNSLSDRARRVRKHADYGADTRPSVWGQFVP